MINKTPATVDAIRFVREVELPPVSRTRGEPIAPVGVTFDQAIAQSAVVGSEIVSFVKGVPASLRQDVMNASLLAQLVANKRVPDRNDIRNWHDAYFEALTNIGWVIQGRSFSQFDEAGNDFEANQAVLQVAATLLGPATAALAVVQSALDAMKSMANGPWITIFRRESQSIRSGRFQVSVVEPETSGGASIALMAFELEAKAIITQLLFFKFHGNEASFRHATGYVSIDARLLEAIAPEISKRVQSFTANYVAQLSI